MPKVSLSNVASQYGIHLSALASNLAPLCMSAMHGKKPALRSSREGSGGAAKAMHGAYDVSEKHTRFRCMVVAIRRRAAGVVPKRLPLDHLAGKQRALIRCARTAARSAWQRTALAQQHNQPPRLEKFCSATRASLAANLRQLPAGCQFRQELLVDLGDHHVIGIDHLCQVNLRRLREQFVGVHLRETVIVMHPAH